MGHDVSKGVAYLHTLSVIHRDLKSLNLVSSLNIIDGILFIFFFSW